MPKKKKPTKSPKEFIGFLEKITKNRSLTYSAIAEGAGLSASYVSDIANGKRIPEAGVCNAIADFLNVSRIEILNMVGWLDLDDDEQFMQAVREKASHDEDFKDLLELYMSLESERERRFFIKFVQTGLSLKE